jgi:hypothetical protein
MFLAFREKAAAWACVQAIPRQERVAIAHIERAGFLTYCPRISVRDRQRREELHIDSCTRSRTNQERFMRLSSAGS